MALAVVLVALAAPALATEEEGTYTDAEPMILWLNKIVSKATKGILIFFCFVCIVLSLFLVTSATFHNG